jgi:HAD superfamily hydrolase (TIGR01549 family)
VTGVALALFDLDNTLIDRADGFGSWATEFAVEYGLGVEVVPTLTDLDQDGYRLRPEFFALVRERFGLRAEVEELWAYYRRTYPEHLRCRPAVLAALAGLRERGWRLGIVTNGLPDIQPAKIARTGLDRYVDGYCVSGVEGVRKPDPEIFRRAAARCGGTLDGGWMVGDHPDQDIGGGRAAGLRTAWIQRPGRWPAWPGRDPGPDATVRDVVDAAALLVL